MSKEGSTEAPIRHPIEFKHPDFLDPKKLDEEMRRVFDICHGCRRCFNLCDSFPKLFDMIDESKNEDVESLTSNQFKPVVDACTLCDMCFMTKCPYVPPHEFNLDFPHLMLRYRTAQKNNNELRALICTGITGSLSFLASIAADAIHGLSLSRSPFLLAKRPEGKIMPRRFSSDAFFINLNVSLLSALVRLSLRHSTGAIISSNWGRTRKISLLARK